MDTRSKVISHEEARSLLDRAVAEPGPAVMTARFDPMTVETAEFVEKVANAHRGAPVLAIVLDTEGTLLPAEARATLVAALRSVTLVTIAAEDSWRTLLPHDFKGSLYYDPQQDAERSQAFVDLILRKESQPAAVAGAR